MTRRGDFAGILLALLLGCSYCGTAQKRPFIDWQNLRNPVLSYPNWSIKDSAMAYRDGTFYVFFSAFYLERGQIRSHVVEVQTRDFKHFSQRIFDSTVRKMAGSGCARQMYSGLTGDM